MLVRFDSEPKISNLRHFFGGEENICRFEISMNNMTLIQIEQPFVNIINNLTDFVFLEKFSLEEPLL